MAHLVVNVAWSSTAWAGQPTKEDLESSHFDYVQDKQEMHEAWNFDLTRYVEDGKKYAYAPTKGTPRSLEDGDLVFFHSRNPATDEFFFVGCFGKAEISSAGFARRDGMDLNIRAPIELCEPFAEDARVLRDKDRHLEGAKRVSQGGMKYISGPTARMILLDARSAYLKAGHDTTRLDRLLALIPRADHRHPIWVLGPWSDVTEQFTREMFDDIVRKGGSTVWWSWGLSTNDANRRHELIEHGFRVGIASGGDVEYFYDVAPGGVEDQASRSMFGQQVPCPWPFLAAPEDLQLPANPDGANKRLLWFKVHRVGRLDPSMAVRDFVSATGRDTIVMTQRGFQFAYPPYTVRPVPFTYDPKMEAAAGRLLRGIEREWGSEARDRLIGFNSEAAHRIDCYPRVTGLLQTRPLDIAALKNLPRLLWPASAQAEREAIPAFLDHPDAPAAISDLLELREDPLAWADAIDAFVRSLRDLGYRAGRDARYPGDASGTLFASILLSARWPDRFVDFRRSHYVNLVAHLGIVETVPTAPGPSLVWAGGLARHLASCPSWQACFETGSLHAVSGLVWQMKNLNTLPDAATSEHSQRLARLRANLMAKGQIILYGPPGTGKTWLARQLPDDQDTTQIVTFHPSTSYEELVEGVRPVLDDHDAGAGVRYQRRDGTFLALCRQADDDRERAHTLIVDEINRGNVSAILGELITLLERDKRAWMKPGTRSERFPEGRNPVRVRLPYSGEEFSVPPNVFVIGTMNTADRSISLVDLALRRRFRFVEVRPEPHLLHSADEVDGVPLRPETRDVLKRIGDVLEGLNRTIAARRGRDFCLGHSYLLPLREATTTSELFNRFEEIWQGEIQPLLAEYFYDEWEALGEVLGESMLEVTDGPGGRAYLGFAPARGEDILLRLEVALREGDGSQGETP